MQKTLQKNFISQIGYNALKICLVTVLLFGFKNSAFAQGTGSVGVGTTTPYANAILDVSSTTKGVLLPRLTAAQRTILTSLLGITANGLLIYNTTTFRFNYWDGTKWNDVGLAGANGADGTEWFTDALPPQTIPSNNLGKPKDFFLDAVTGDIYKKGLDNIWVRYGNPLINLKSANKRELAAAPGFSVASGFSGIQTYAFAGAVVGNAVVFSPKNALPDGLIISYARVSATDVIEVKFYNASGTLITVPASDYEIAIVK